MVIETASLQALKNFSVMVEEGSLTRAADKLNLDRSALRKQFCKLEDDFGRKLYNSSKKTGIILTPAGEILYSGIKRALNVLMLTEKEMNESEDITLGKISLAISRDIQKYYMSDILNNFMDKNNILKIKFINSNYKDVIRKIREYNIDLIIDEIEIKQENDKHIIIPLFEDNYCLAFNSKLNTENLESIPIVLPIKENFCRKKITTYLEQNNIKYCIKYELSDFESIADFIKEKPVAGIVPYQIAKEKELIFKSLENDLKYRISVLYDQENLTKSTQTFIDFIKENY